MNLKHLTDSTLLADTKTLVRQEQALLIKTLWHLKEVDGRRLYATQNPRRSEESSQHERSHSFQRLRRRLNPGR